MSDTELPSRKFFWIVVGGFVTLVFGIAGGSATSYLTQSSAELTYTLTAVDFFEGQQNNLGVVTLDVSNPGRKEIEALECNVKLSDAKIKEPRFTGLTPTGLTLNSGTDFVTATLPFFNPKESFSLQVLVEPPAAGQINPEVEVRGKGILGLKVNKNEAAGHRGLEILPLTAGLLTALIAQVTSLRILKRKTPLIHRLFDSVVAGKEDVLGYDKQEMFAFVLGINAFYEYAQEIRFHHSKKSWLSYSDMLTEYAIVNSPADSTAPTRAITALQTILKNIEGLRPTTSAVVNTNIARLHAFQGNTAKARTFLETAKQEQESIAEGRRALIPELVKLNTTEKQAIVDQSTDIPAQLLSKSSSHDSGTNSPPPDNR